jgi:uncharacterized protein
LALLFTLASAALAAALNFPALTGRVVDQANVMSAATRSALDDKLKALEDKSGIQLVVATVSSLEGQEIEPYANQLFRNWKLGEEKKNNGVLFLVAPNEHKVRVEVGYGLEGTLTDATSKIIILNAVAPRFKAKDFDGGISRGVDDVITTLTTDSSEWQKRPELREKDSSSWIVVLAIALFALVFGFLLVGFFRRLGHAIASGFANASVSRGSTFSSGSAFSTSSSFSDSSSSFSSSSSSDSFSGGGGSSGGGGASGDW